MDLLLQSVIRPTMVPFVYPAVSSQFGTPGSLPAITTRNLPSFVELRGIAVQVRLPVHVVDRAPRHFRKLDAPIAAFFRYFGLVNQSLVGLYVEKSSCKLLCRQCAPALQVLKLYLVNRASPIFDSFEKLGSPVLCSAFDQLQILLNFLRTQTRLDGRTI
jgi:hypothetical protein